MNFPTSLLGQRPKATDVSPWYGVYHEVHEDHEEFYNQIISTTGFHTPWSTKGKSCRFSPLWSNGLRLQEGTPIGAVPAASRRVSLIIKFYFVSFVLFVVIFLSRYNLLSLCENVQCRISPFFRSKPLRLESEYGLARGRKVKSVGETPVGSWVLIRDRSREFGSTRQLSSLPPVFPSGGVWGG